MLLWHLPDFDSTKKCYTLALCEDLTRFSPPYAWVCSAVDAVPREGDARYGFSSGFARSLSAVGRSAGLGAIICARSIRKELLKVGSSASLPSRMAWYVSPPASTKGWA